MRSFRYIVQTSLNKQLTLGILYTDFHGNSVLIHTQCNDLSSVNWFKSYVIELTLSSWKLWVKERLYEEASSWFGILMTWQNK